MDAPVTLTIPADPGFVHVARTVTSGVASRLEMSYDVVDDLRIAVDEACNRLMSLRRGGSRLILRVRPESDALTLAVSLDADPDPWPSADAEETLSWMVISGLADDSQETRINGEPTIVMRWRTLIAPAR